MDTAPHRVLFVGLANHGHLYPFMPLALAVRAAGHDVVFATGAEFAAPVRALGFEVVQVGASIGWGFREAVRRHPELSVDDEQQVAPIATELLADRVLSELLPLLAAAPPTVLVHEPYCLGAGLAARLAGLPVVSYVQGRALPAMMWTAVAAGLSDLWRRYGGTGGLPDWSAGPLLDYWPASLQEDPPALPLPHRYPLRPQAWNEPAAPVPAWLTGPRRRPLVYLAMSTVFGLPTEVLRAAVAGVAELDVDVLAVLGPQHDPADLGALPAGVRVERFVAQAAVLPHADVVVSHGGSGTLLGALENGRPQLVLPYGADQFANARDVARVGAGLELAPAAATRGTVRDAVGALLIEPAFQLAARVVAVEIASMPAPAELVPVLGALSAGRDAAGARRR
jgi:UDP:flavonoid glycosyltransferase YjiC (YdhE family)